MRTRSADQATDCSVRSTDWTTLGARIRHAADLASAIHQMEEGQGLRVSLREPAGERGPSAGIPPRDEATDA